jgi:hypothetical protein
VNSYFDDKSDGVFVAEMREEHPFKQDTFFEKDGWRQLVRHWRTGNFA